MKQSDSSIIAEEVRCRVEAFNSKGLAQWTKMPEYQQSLRNALNISPKELASAEAMLGNEDIVKLLGPFFTDSTLRVQVLCSVTGRYVYVNLTLAEKLAMGQNWTNPYVSYLISPPSLVNSSGVWQQVYAVCNNTNISMASKIIPNLLVLSPTAAKLHASTPAGKRNRQPNRSKWQAELQYFESPEVVRALAGASMDDGILVDY